MRVVLQRVSSAGVQVEGETVGAIEKGYLLFVGIGPEDTQADCARLADKILRLRIFPDTQDKINLSLGDVGGEVLVVSQFTLYADCRKGNRPSFVGAAKPDKARRLYEYFAGLFEGKVKRVQTGSFGADMKVSLINDGPFTLMLE